MVINGYDIKSEIYRGPVTTVYDANHLDLGRRVILKVLNSQWTEDKDLIERFRREAKICARLDHPNIVKIFDFNTSKDSIFISMEYIEGSTLETYIQKNKTINFSEIIDITSQILSGLSYAHKQGITHRDIKPSNIMISAEGQVKITDFGLASVSDLPGITGQDQAVGSPAYMSPEQALGKEIDPRSDLFSLGVCLYRTCAQKPPFETENIGTTIQNILYKEVENLSNVNTAVPSWFSDLINSLLSKNRDNRPESAASVLNSIHAKYKIYDLDTPYLKLSSGYKRNVKEIGKSVVHYVNFKFQSRIFFLLIPVFFIFIYLMLEQSDESRSEQSIKNNNLVHFEDINDSDPITVIPPNIPEGDKFIAEDISKKQGNVTTPGSDRIFNISGNLSDTSATMSDLERSQVFIIAKPWADVYIDSIFYEETPLSKPISLKPGIHYLELKNPGFKTFSRLMELYPAQSETLIVEMQMNVGFLNIRILPWAEIYIDGEYLETSPLENPMTLAAGKHVLTLTNPNFISLTDTIEIISGKMLDKKFKLIK